MKRLNFPAILLLTQAVSCHSPAPVASTDKIGVTALAAPDFCQTRIPPLSLNVLPPQDFTAPVSQLVADLKLDTSPLLSRLASQVPPRVASGNDLDAGSAGRITFAVDRGPFSLSIRAGRLHLSTELSGQASLCKPVPLLGCVEYGSCSPGATAEASLPLSLDSAFRLEQASFNIHVTRPCHVSVANFDATPLIQSRANREAQTIRSKINSQLPSFESPVRALWSAFGLTIPLGIQTRLRFFPENIVLGQANLKNKTLSIPVGIRMRVAVEPGGPVDRKNYPLPHPLQEASLTPGISLDLPILIESESLSENLTRSLVSNQNKPTKIVSARAYPSQDELAIVLSVSGPTCGDLLITATPQFDSQTNRVRLTHGQISQEERKRLAPFLQDLDLESLLGFVEAKASIDLPVDVDAVPKGLKQAASLLVPKHGPRLQLDVADSQVGSVVLAPKGLIVVVNTRGSATIVVN